MASKGTCSIALAKLREIRQILHPRGNPDASWSPDTLDEIDSIILERRTPPRRKSRRRRRG